VLAGLALEWTVCLLAQVVRSIIHKL